MRRFLSAGLASTALVLGACADAVAPVPSSATPELAAGVVAAQAAAAPRGYIITFRSDVADVPGLAQRLAAQGGGELGFVYQRALKGFSVRLPEQAVAALARHPQVAPIEPDLAVSVNGTQSNATWGLDRIDQRDRPLNATYTYATTGNGVRIYILDTGVRLAHAEFTGRITSGFSAIADGRGADDCHGHGTHVAGTAGGSTWGVAKQATIVPVRVLDCTGGGTMSGVIAGVEWVIADHVKPAVANMSLGGGASASLDLAINNAVAAGVTVVVAAGNNNADACNYSPARAVSALTIGATTSSDARSSFSNVGTCVDLFAPGSSITSAYHTSNTATSSMSGTSMASPHVAGVAALVLEGAPGASPAQVGAAIIGQGSLDRITGVGTGSPNVLLFSGAAIDGGSIQPPPTPPANQAPTASFSVTCAALSCSVNGSASSDPDGSIASFAWSFGDGSSASGAAVSKTYAAAGTYSITLTVTDNAGASASSTRSVTVTAPAPPPPPPSAIALTVTTSKVRGSTSARLGWTGASGSVDVYRNGSKAATVSGSSWTDNIGKGGGSRSYQVCNAGTSTCSNSVTITY
jgi:serine protease